MGEDGTKSCFLCDSKERLEMCSKCHLISACVHHTHLHRWFVLLYFIILLPTWVKQEIPLSYIFSARHMFQRHWYRRVLPIHSGPRGGSWQVLDCHLCPLYLCLCFCIFEFVSSVRSSNSHPDLLLTQHQHPTFSDHTGPQHWTFTFWATTAI